jgi:glycosyltransferase involved in cell wall biosynthesis
MKITFIFPREKEYNSKTVRELPSGGTEKATIFLGEAFQKLGHEVQWISELGQVADTKWPDVVITQEARYLENFPSAKKVFWTHHFSDQPIIQRNAAYGRCFADHIVSLSQCHHDDLANSLKLASVIIGHGVWRDELVTGVEKDPYRLIYASTPFRGLVRIPELFRSIQAVEPRATIAICSSMKTYGESQSDAEYEKLFEELSNTPGVELKGALNQAQLYAEYARASIFFYPCNWAETYCLALDEAIAHGCLPVVSNLGALKERTSACYPAVDFVQLITTIGFKTNNPEMVLASKQPKDWLEVAKEWEEKVLNATR